MKKFLRIAAICFLTAVLCLSVVGCGGGSIPANTVLMWVAGGSDEIRYLDTVATAYNKIDDSKQVRFITMGTFNTMLESFKYGNNLPDLVYIDDEYFKRFVDGGFLKPLDELLEESTLDLSAMWPQAVSRYRYNPENNTSSDSDPLWAIPKELDSTVLYYNEGAFEDSGITVISVSEDKIDEFNAGTYRDGNGKLKSEYPALAGSRKVLPKGFMRDNPYTKGNAWAAPQSGELLVFNNRIPMSWDETEDLAMYMTRSYRTSSPTLYGYYTEFWFNYGWSVGGDCVGDINGNGQWEFTLDDDNPNYKVLKDTSINGVDYKASGEDDFVFVEYKDKKWLAENSAQAEALEASGNLEKFPSTLEAFTRFAALSRDKTSADPVGLAVSQKPSVASATDAAMGRFNMGSELAMFVGFSDSLSSFSTRVNWNIAPLPVYKTYNLNGTVKQIGARAGHGRGYAVGIVSSTQKTEIAMNFLDYFLGESGQKELAKRGARVPNNKAIAMSDWMKSGKNYEQVVIETQYQRPGDWWYMPERAWIANWSQPLNQNATSVRNSTLTLSDYFNQIKAPTNEALQKFWKN